VTISKRREADADQAICQKEKKAESATVTRREMWSGDGQSGNLPWWQQLLGAELLVGAFVVLWYIWSYLFYYAIYSAYRLPVYLLDISLVKLLKLGVRPFLSFVSYYFCIYFSFRKKTMRSYVMMMYFMLSSIFFWFPDST
jgi:hypothetical protein